MAVVGLFSKRMKAQRGEVPDVYTYGALPVTFRNQYSHMQKSLSLHSNLAADIDQRFALLTDPETEVAVRSWMGDDAYAELLAHSPGPAHLGAGPKNIVFAPCVMGTTLLSNGLGGIGWLDLARGRAELSKLGLSRDGLSDLDPDADIDPGSVNIAYSAFLRTTLMVHGSELWPNVDRIVLIGTPHHGSPAIAGYLKNHFWGRQGIAVLGI